MEVHPATGRSFIFSKRLKPLLIRINILVKAVRHSQQPRYRETKITNWRKVCQDSISWKRYFNQGNHF